MSLCVWNLSTLEPICRELSIIFKSWSWARTLHTSPGHLSLFKLNSKYFGPINFKKLANLRPFDIDCLNGPIWPHIHFETQIIHKGKRNVPHKSYFYLICMPKSLFQYFMLIKSPTHTRLFWWHARFCHALVTISHKAAKENKIHLVLILLSSTFMITL